MKGEFMNKIISCTYCMILLFIVSVFANITYAQQVRTIQISPEITGQTDGKAMSDVRPSIITPEIQKGIERQLKQSETVQSQSQSVLLQPSAVPAPQPAAEDVSSEFEQFIAGRGPSDISTEIKQFGYDLFLRSAGSFSLPSNVPVGPDYVVGPGDEIRITVWGKIEGRWDVPVDRDGNVTLPKIGVVGVTGLTFNELKDALYREISRYYTGFEMNVSMGSLRSMKVYVVGNAKSPGSYEVSSLSSLVNALFVSGGPAKTGSMRDIQVKRNGATITHFDMYDFLLNGDKTRDIRLMPEDVVFVPAVGPLVGIAGNVRVPAIYELRNETRLLDLFKMAGGLTSTAFKGRVQVQRIEEHQFRTLFEGDLVDLENNPDKNFVLMDGDLIKVFSVTEANNTVKLVGAVVNEGDYAIVPGETRLSDVISKAGGVLYYASDEAELTRVSVTQSGPVTELLNINVSLALKGDPEHNIPLKINDYLFVRTVPEWKLYRTVSVSGEVKYPGTYTIKIGERLSSLIERAGGFTRRAYIRGAVFTRNSVKDIQQKALTDMIERLERELLTTGSVQASTALSGEEVASRTLEMEHKRRFIETLKQLKATGRMSIKLANPRLLKNTEYDIEFEEGDSLMVPMRNSVVSVIGAVMSRGSFVYSGDIDFKDYISMAGGYASYADKDNIYVLKVDGTARKLTSGLLSWNSSRTRWEMSSFGEEIKEIEPGDTIVVPEKLERIAWLREIKDVTQILYQIAVTAGVLIVAF
ncbi:MAG: polysaccharide export protein [Nitrospiraceae bacterium]|nr:MAG: polysaccharide export protein [Nitrospiraceae bacterium]